MGRRLLEMSATVPRSGEKVFRRQQVEARAKLQQHAQARLGRRRVRWEWRERETERGLTIWLTAFDVE